MARIRSIHPGMASDEAYMSMSIAAKAAWPLLWTECDDHGVFEWKPIVLKARIFPADNVDFALLLVEWSDLDCIKMVEINGKPHGIVRNFCRYQRPKKPTYRYELPDEFHLYAGLTAGSSPQVTHRLPTASEEAPQRKEEGGSDGEEGRAREADQKSDPVPEAERGKSLISEQAFEVSALVLSAMGLDPQHPLSCGSPLTVQGWFNAGWHRDCILAGVRRTMQNRGRDPPSTLKYFEKAIARTHAELTPDLPKADGAPCGERPSNSAGFRTTNSRTSDRDGRPTGHDAVLAAAARRARRIGDDHAMAGTADAVVAPAGLGVGRGGSDGRPGAAGEAARGAGAGQAGSDDGGRVEIIPPDPPPARIADRARNI
jgi:hypothetical protein